MTMHTSFDSKDVVTASQAETVGCLHDMLVTTLEIVDQLTLPGDIGAHLDMTISRLGQLLPADRV